jgi:ring-1,2-phenylacetyl-CoA epoxidase subunit PaaD
VVTAVLAQRTASLDDVRRAVEDVLDPEVPVLTLGDLGIVRAVRESADGGVEVDLTPTYSGCPATEVIAAMVRDAVAALGREARVRTVLSPAWTTDWMSADGRRKLAEFGIVPPTGRAPVAGPVPVSIGRPGTTTGLPCPRCGATDTQELARFGSTACKSLWRCGACGEPFDHFKAI